MNIVPSNDNNNSSPFDSIRKVDEKGNEYWTGRELMPMLGYTNWRQFNEVIQRAIASCNNHNESDSNHFYLNLNLVKRAQGGGSKQEDYKLSRYASYLVAMNGDPRKPEIAAAQAYFVTKTREAETIIPVQTDRIRELELQNESLKLEVELIKAKKRLLDAETAQLQFRQTVIATCPELVQQKILGYQTVKEVEYRDRVIYNGQVLKDGDTITKTELCRRYSLTTRSGAPDYKKLSKYLDSLPPEAWESVPSVRDNQELKREYLDVLDSRFYNGGDRQLFLGEELS